MVLTDVRNGVKAVHQEYGFGVHVDTEAFEYRQKNNMESPSEPLHSTKHVRCTIQKEQHLIKELEVEAECLEIKMSSRIGEERGEESSKRPKVQQVQSELFQLLREIRLRKFALKVARAAFAQFMLAGDDDDDDDATMDLSDVVHLASETCLDDTDSSEVSEGQLREMVESRLEMLGLYVKKADHWNVQLGFLMNQEIEV